jgi:hypothetical protein
LRSDRTLLQVQTAAGGNFVSYQSDVYDADGHLTRGTTYQLSNNTEAGVLNNAVVTFRWTTQPSVDNLKP